MPQLTPELAFVTTATNGVVAAPLHFSWGYFMHPVRLSVAVLSISVALFGCTTQEQSPGTTATEADAAAPDPADANSTDTSDASDAPDPADATDSADATDAADPTDSGDTSDTTDASDVSDTSDASDPSTTEPDPECTDGDTQNGTTACGLNNEGVFIQTCENGSWMDTDTCTGTDICQNDTTQAGSETCGLNNEGTFEELCADGAWTQTETCSGTDVCVNGTLDYQVASCAGGAAGAKTLECANGAWTEETVCLEAGNTSYSAMGRTITFTNVNMNGTGNGVAQVQPGASTSLQVAGSVVNNQTSCPGCITQFYVRLNGIMNLCLGSTTGNWSFNESTTFTAPTEPGIYYVNSTETWDYNCVNSTGVSTEYNSRTVAMLVVSGPDGTDNGDNGNGDDDNTGGACDTSGLTAGTGTVQVQAFNGTVLNWATAQNETFTFPAESEHFVSATMHMTLECPDGGCDPWDRYGSVTLKHSSGENHEIARFITPYAIDASSGYPGSCAWSYDVTPFEHLLRGEQELSLFISTWIGGDRGWKVTVTFDFERGIPELEPYRVVNLWDFGHLVYGNPGNPVTDHLVDQPVVFDEETESAMVRVTVTGHGQGNTDNAAEFSMRWHEVSAGNSADAWTPWRYDCAQNVCSPQGGNWQYGRAGWCPGDGVWPRDIDVTSEIATNASVAFGYEIEPYENCCRPDNPSCNHNDGNCCISFAGECGWNYTGHTEPNFDLNAQLVLYRCPQ